MEKGENVPADSDIIAETEFEVDTKYDKKEIEEEQQEDKETKTEDEEDNN